MSGTKVMLDIEDRVENVDFVLSAIDENSLEGFMQECDQTLHLKILFLFLCI